MTQETRGWMHHIINTGTDISKSLPKQGFKCGSEKSEKSLSEP